MASPIDNTVIELTKEDLATLLCQHFGSDVAMKSFTTAPLTAPGDNYGSTVLAVEVTYQNGQDQTLHKLSLVAKLAPPEACSVASFIITFKKEVRAYTLVCPEFISLQKEIGLSDDEILDVFPKFYGARTNRQGDINEKADDTAFLLLENLKISGYCVGNRRIGFNLNHMELVIKSLAVFHALGVVIKLKKPEVFKDKFRKICEEFRLERKCWLGTSDEENEKMLNTDMDLVKSIPECEPYVEKIEKKWRLEIERIKDLPLPSPNGPFTTFIHNDFWVNNMMFKYEPSDNSGNENYEDKIPTEVKFLDFQETLYDSPVTDLMFFLFSSSKAGIIENHLDDLLHLYHKEFTDVLKKAGCDASSFSFQDFQNELNEFAPQEFIHILFALNFATADEKGRPISELLKVMNVEAVFENTGKEVGIYANKVRILVLEFAKRGWL